MSTIVLIVMAVAALVFFAMKEAEKQEKGTKYYKKKPPTHAEKPTEETPEYKDKVWVIQTEKQNKKSPQYRDKFRLMNNTEHLLFQRLVEAVPAMLVFSQVSMSQVFHINGSTRDGYRQLGEVGRKSIDFLICRSDDTSIVAAIELNGPTHESEKQKTSDAKKRKALETAGIPLIVLKPGELPEMQELRKLLAPHIVGRRKYEEERDKRLQQKSSH